MPLILPRQTLLLIVEFYNLLSDTKGKTSAIQLHHSTSHRNCSPSDFNGSSIIENTIATAKETFLDKQIARMSGAKSAFTIFV